MRSARSLRHGLLAAAALMAAGAGAEIDNRVSIRHASEPHRRRYQPPRDTQQQREIAEHNAAIDAQRAAKKAAKKGKR